jgi:uncharacterized repeat protein (TIGR03803 family)
VFKVNPDGTGFSLMHSFPLATATDGQNPYGSLVGAGTTLYGETLNGGASGTGALFKIATDGTGFTLLHSLLGGLLLRRRHIKVDVGLDGIRVRHGGHDRFMPFHAIEWVRALGPKVLSFQVRGEAEVRWFSFVGFDTFVHRVEEARRLADSQSGAPPVLAATSVNDYRQSAYPKEVLLRVVEDGGQNVVTRATAADALRFRLEPEERERVRTVAATTASADLRQHFEDLAASEDEVLYAEKVPAQRLRT